MDRSQMDLRMHFGLERMPFSPVLKPKELYIRESMETISSQMSFCLNSGFFYTLVGEVGAGKSTALSYAVSKLPQKQWAPIMVMGFASTFTELLRQILISMNVFIKTGQQSRMLKLIGECFASFRESGKAPVLVIDEAHMFAPDVFQQMHILSQQVPAGNQPVPVVLCGQDQLVEKMAGPFCKPLMSRVMNGYMLTGMSQEECSQYISHHLRTLCGASGDIFDDMASIAVCQASGGIPRRINEICLKAMALAMDAGRQSVCMEDVRKAGALWWNR